MKNSILKAILFVLCILAFSCEEGFLDRPPLNTDNADSFWSSENEVIGAVNSLYNGIARPMGYNVGHVAIGDVGADDMRCFDANWFVELDNFQAKSTGILFNGIDGHTQGVWAVMYAVIFRANWVLNNVNEVSDISESIRNRSIYEAKFLRALSYFTLTNVFGEVPLITSIISSNEGFEIAKSPKKDIIDFVHNELLECAGLDESGNSLGQSFGLPRKGEYELGRATKGAALALLARSYLYESEYEMAAKVSKSLIDQGNYDLEWSDYGANWDNLIPNGIESIFEIQVEPLGQPSAWGMRPGSWILDFTVNKNFRPGVLGGWQIMVPDSSVVGIFEYNEDGSDKDLRREMTIYKEGDRYEFAPTGLELFIPEPPTYLLLSKYSRRNRRTEPASQPLSLSAESDSNIPVIRYAEVLLIYAESNFMLGNADVAFEYLNMIRRRAGLEEFDGSEDFMEKLIHERRIEFMGEGHRFFDLRRWGKLEEVLDPIGYRSETNGYYPLPQNDLDLNPNLLPQNPGY